MRLNRIIDRFALISGLEPAGVSLWTPLCIDAMGQIERSVKSGVKKDEVTLRRLENCAAALAYYKYSLFAKETQVSAFSAGNMSVSIATTERERAKALWQEERGEASDIIDTGEDFCFKGVTV